ncbi:MAG: hypothetical protein NVS4B6_16490 [Mycobacterium sp.]
MIMGNSDIRPVNIDPPPARLSGCVLNLLQAYPLNPDFARCATETTQRHKRGKMPVNHRFSWRRGKLKCAFGRLFGAPVTLIGLSAARFRKFVRTDGFGRRGAAIPPLSLD